MPPPHRRCVKVNLVQGLARAVQEVLAAQLLALRCGAGVAVPDGAVERHRFCPSVWVVVSDPAPPGVAVERAADTGGLHRLPETAFPEVLQAAGAVEGVTRVLAGRISEGMRLLDEAATAAGNGEVGDYLTIGEIYCHMLACCELTLDVRRAEQWIAAGTSFGTESNAPWVSAICRTHYGGILTAAGRWDDAERELESSIALYDASYGALRSSALVRLADLRVRQGRYDEAARLLAGFEFDSYAVRPLARLHLARGEHDVARRLLRRFLDQAGEHRLQAPELALLAEVELAAGRVEQAQAIAQRLDAIATGANVPRIRALARYTAGIVGAAAGETGAVAHLEAALPDFARAGLPLETARTRLAISRTLADTAPEVAVAEARAALETFDALAATPDANATASHLRALGEPGRAAPRGEGALTKRESEVLAHLAHGRSNTEIAQLLFISKRTAEHHVSNILAKLGLTTRAEAIAHALRRSSPAQKA